MGAMYMWLVQVYYWDYDPYSDTYHKWVRYYKYDKVFKNKPDAMQYVIQCRRADGIDAKLVKWYGD